MFGSGCFACLSALTTLRVEFVTPLEEVIHVEGFKAGVFLPTSLVNLELCYHSSLQGIPGAVVLAGPHLRHLFIKAHWSDDAPDFRGLEALQALTGLRLAWAMLAAVPQQVPG